MCPTSAMAKLTMRRDKPPAFITSPASMKNGTASSGKLLAPSITFCASIWASNMLRCHIKAAPHKSKEKAIGTPSAMAASKEPRKIVMVISGLFFQCVWLDGLLGVWRLFRFLNKHQVGIVNLPGYQPP